MTALFQKCGKPASTKVWAAFISQQDSLFRGRIGAGIDEEEWNPSTDVHIAEKYSVSNFTQGKAKNKAALQRELGLPERPEVPLLGFIGRLDYQKGADLVLAAAPWLIAQDAQLVCLGTGDSGLEVHMRSPSPSYTEWTLFIFILQL